MRDYYPWLPQKTSTGEDLACQNCKHYGEKNELRHSGKCGTYGWLCGIWEEAKEVQLEFMEAKSDND